MNYDKLKQNLSKYGRDNGFAYVCSSFKPELRQDKKYQQWKRVLNDVILKAMTPEEKRVLQSIFELSFQYKKDLLK